MLEVGIIGLITTTVILIGYLITNNNKDNKEKKDNNSYDKSITELIPIIDYDNKLNCYVYKDGTLMDLMQIKSQNLADLSNDEREFMTLKYSRWYKKYAPDIKLIMMNFPSDISKQRKYWENKFEKTINPIFRQWQAKKIQELQWIEKNKTSREFYFMYWGANEKEIKKNREQHIESLGTGPLGYISLLDREKKDNILYKYCNMNSIVNVARNDR